MNGSLLYTEKQEYGKIKIDKIYKILEEATKDKNNISLNNDFISDLLNILENHKINNRNVIFEIKEPDIDKIEKELLSIDITSFSKKGKELKKYLEKLENLILDKFNIKDKILKFTDLDLKDIKDSFSKNYLYFKGVKPTNNKPSAYIRKYNILLNIVKEKKGLTEEDKETIKILASSIKNSYFLSSGKHIEYLINLNSFLLKKHKNQNYNFFNNIKLLEKEINKYIKLDTDLDRKNIKILAAIFRNIPFRIKETKIEDALDSINNKEINLIFNFDILLNNPVNNSYSNLISGIDKDLLKLINLEGNNKFKDSVENITTNEYSIIKTYIHMSIIYVATNILFRKMENLFKKNGGDIIVPIKRFNKEFFDKEFNNNLDKLEKKIENSNINFHNILSRILALGLIYSNILGISFNNLLAVKDEYLKLIENLNIDGSFNSIIEQLKSKKQPDIDKFIEIVKDLNDFVVKITGKLLNDPNSNLKFLINFIDNLSEEDLRSLKQELYNKTFQNFQTRFFTVDENVDIINKYIKMETEKEISQYYEKPDNLFKIKGMQELESFNTDLKDKIKITERYKTNIKEVIEKNTIIFILNLGNLEENIELEDKNEKIIKSLRKENKFLLDIDIAINDNYKLELVAIISLIIYIILSKKIKEGYNIKLLFLFNQEETEENNEILNNIKILLSDIEYLHEGKTVTKGLVKTFDKSFKYRLEQDIYSLLNNNITKEGTLNIEHYPLLKKYFDNNKDIKELKILNLFNGFYKKRINAIKYIKPTRETYVKYDNETNYILLTKAVPLKIIKLNDKEVKFIRYPVYSFFEEIENEKILEEIIKEENIKIFENIKTKLENILNEDINILNIKFKVNKYLRRSKFLNIKDSIKPKDEDNEIFSSYLDIATVEVSKGLRKMLENNSIFIQTEYINYIIPTNNLLKNNKLKSINNNTITNKYLYEVDNDEKIFIEDIDRIILLTDGTRKIKTSYITFSLNFVNDMFKTSLERTINFYYEYRENKFVRINLIGLSFFNIIKNTLK